MRIYIATHKPAPFPADPGYIPIQNGKAVSQIDLNLLGDDTGVNISDKMPSYSECCTLYWIAQNVQDEFVGLAHYRRYFSPVSRSVRVGDYDVASSLDFPELAGADLIVCNPMDFSPLSVEQQYATAHVERDLVLVRGAIRKLYPAYVEDYDHVIQAPYMTPYNVFVGRMPLVKEYAKWLFDIMFLLEEWIPFRTYDEYQGRVFSFLSERLFTIWLHHNNRKWRVLTRHVMALPY